MESSGNIFSPAKRLRRLCWLLLALWTAAIACSLIWNVRGQEEKVRKIAGNTAQITFEKDVDYRRWGASQGGVYVPVSDQTPSNPYLNMPDRDVTTSSGVALTLVNPAYMARLVNSMSGTAEDVRTHITSLNPIRPANRADAWETAALKAFERGEKEVSSTETMDGEEYVRFMRPFLTEKSCLKCHAAQGYMEGDVRGGISISVPTAPLRAIERAATTRISLVHFVLWAAGVMGILVSRNSLCKEISSREQAEQALREAHRDLEARVEQRTAELQKTTGALEAEHQRFQDVLDILPAYVILLSPDYHVPFANRFFEGRFGKSEGRRCYEYLFNRTEPCEICETYSVLKTNAPHHWEWTGPDGRNYDIYDFPFTDVDGSRLIMEVGLDITEQKKAETALKTANETLEQRVAERTAALETSRATLENERRRLALLSEVSARLLASSDAQHVVEDLCRRAMAHLNCDAFFNFLVDEKAGRLRLNACAGIPDEEVRRIEWLDYGQAVCGCAARESCRIVAEHIPTTLDPRTELVRSYGIKAYACLPLLGPGGKVIGTLSFGTRKRETFSEDDLSLMKAVADQVAVAMTRMRGEQELREAKTAAEEANATKDKFLAVLSHELRTPLSPVLMIASALELEESLPESIREDMGMVRRSVELEVRLINDLLDFNRVKWSKLHLDLRPMDIHEKLRAAVEICRSEVHEKQISLSCELSATTSCVNADGARLQQVFWNLLKNAIKFTADRGRIEVRSNNPEPGTLRITVTDNGVGIDPAALPHVFEPFVQASSHVARQFGGLGLGLAISKSLVEMHGGTIRVDSAGLGKGAAFTVELPIAPAPEQQQQAARPQNGIQKRGLKVLIVEDHDLTAEVLSKLLIRMGHQVSTAGTTAEGLERLQAVEFDLLISDLGLPDGSGHELMRKARRIRPALCGFAMSGYGMDADLQKSREAGFLEHLTKPVDIQMLQAAIGRIVP